MDKRSRAKQKLPRHPFWQADKPYLHDHTVTDVRFRHLGYMMAFSAGAINSGGFFAVANYTSHVSGALSRVADTVVLHEWYAALTALGGVLSFLLGGILANLTILYGKRYRFRSCYGLPMWLEAVCLLLFGIFGIAQSRMGEVMLPPTLLLLCFIMGIHNTVMSVLSGGAVRSTHMTGSTTDLGIEIAKMLYCKHHPQLSDVHVNFLKMRLLTGLILYFVLGGIVGAYGYHRIGHYFTLPVAAMLFIVGAGSVGYDVRIRIKWWLIHKIQQAEEYEIKRKSKKRKK